MDPSAPCPPFTTAGPGEGIVSVQHFMEILGAYRSVPTSFENTLRLKKAHLLARSRIIDKDAPREIQNIFPWLPNRMYMSLTPPPFLISPQLEFDQIIFSMTQMVPLLLIPLQRFSPPPGYVLENFSKALHL